MAVGDDAVAAGLALVADSDDLNDGAMEINLTRDYIAQEKTARTAAVALKLDATKLIISESTPAVVNGAIWVKPVS